jgi:hypothetical protein
MKLKKFFRKYSRVLLMVAMALLLIVWLLGDLRRNTMNPSRNPKIKYGRVYGRDITLADYDTARSKQIVMTGLGFRDAGMVPDALTLCLLLDEAQHMGVHIGREQAKAALVQSDDVARVQQRLEALQKQTGYGYDAMYDIAAEWLAVRQILEAQTLALGDSLPRAEKAYRDQRQQAEVSVCVLDAKAFTGFVPEPAEPDLQAFYEQNKDRSPNHTEDQLQFGYLRPNRVRVEYLTIDPQVVQDKLRLKERELQAYYEDHKKSYTKSVPGASSAPASQPVTVPMTFEEAKERVRKELRQERSIQEAQRVVNDIRQAAYAPWQTIPRDPTDGFRPPPAAGAQKSFAELRDKFTASSGYEVTYGKTELLDQDGLVKAFDRQPEMVRRQYGSREPVYVEGQTRIPLSEFALRVKGIFKPGAEEKLPVLNVLEPSPVVIGNQYDPATRKQVPNQAYVFRVIEVAPEGPPESFEAVRLQVREDFKLQEAYKLAGEQARLLGERARQVGPAAAVEEAAALKDMLAQAEEAWLPPAVPDPDQPPATRPEYVKALGPAAAYGFSRMSSTVRGIGTTTKVQRVVFGMADAGWAEPDPTHAMAVVEVASAFKWAVAELEGLKPLYEGDFEGQRSRFLTSSMREEQREVVLGWLYPGNVEKRTGFVRDPGAARLLEQAERD